MLPSLFISNVLTSSLDVFPVAALVVRGYAYAGLGMGGKRGMRVGRCVKQAACRGCEFAVCATRSQGRLAAGGYGAYNNNMTKYYVDNLNMSMEANERGVEDDSRLWRGYLWGRMLLTR
jgi:hypothetical protein